jgi:hypothetical protein
MKAMRCAPPTPPLHGRSGAAVPEGGRTTLMKARDETSAGGTVTCATNRPFSLTTSRGLLIS